jgi:Mandelate racemase / muconate lactonizing enzyme, N-terminal domain
VTVKVYTEQGIYGLGDATLNGRELAVVSYLQDHLIPCLIGRDPFQTEDIWQYFYRGAYWRASSGSKTRSRLNFRKVFASSAGTPRLLWLSVRCLIPSGMPTSDHRTVNRLHPDDDRPQRGNHSPEKDRFPR